MSASSDGSAYVIHERMKSRDKAERPNMSGSPGERDALQTGVILGSPSRSQRISPALCQQL